MENWAKLLYTYGPFALLFLFVFVIERKSRTALTDSGIPRRISVSVYLLNWCTIFVLCGAVTYFWAVLNLPHEITIRGTIENLKANESFFSDSDDLWLQRDYRTPSSYHWRLIASEKLADGTKESLTIQLPNDRAFKYDLPVRANFYNGPVRLRYDRNTSKLLVDYAQKHEELTPSEALSSMAVNSSFPGLVYVVHAQSSSSLDEILDRLESDDPIVRRDARRDLASQGHAALPRIESVLQDARASYRLQVGCLVALNLMQNVVVSPQTRARIEALYEEYRNSDPVVSSEAERYLHNLPAPTCGVRCGTERWVVKAFADQDISKVNLTPKQITVSELISLVNPGRLPADSRVSPVELQTYRVSALLLSYKQERSDLDFHLTIADPQNVSNTMIAEIPDPECSSVCASTQVSRISHAREMFAARFHPEFQFKHLDIPVQVSVTGIGFFDFAHRQSGRAPNGIELHPVLDIEFSQ